jgi:hypothetical protein
MRSHRPTTNLCPNRATVDRRVSSRTMCFDLTTHSQMLSCEDCTIRVVLDMTSVDVGFDCSFSRALLHESE